MRPDLKARLEAVKQKRAERREDVRREVEDIKVETVKAKSIPELRLQVQRLAEQVEVLLGKSDDSISR